MPDIEGLKNPGVSLRQKSRKGVSIPKVRRILPSSLGGQTCPSFLDLEEISKGANEKCLMSRSYF